jgi:mono/diheme cytochrome c family protein
VKAQRAISFFLTLLAFSLTGVMRSTARPQQTAPAKVDESVEGEKRFAANCGRCHQPPQDISPREVKAVLRHMRVRAMLSAEDERLILKFLAP